jgi:hypothetical protein
MLKATNRRRRQRDQQGLYLVCPTLYALDDAGLLFLAFFVLLAP